MEINFDRSQGGALDVLNMYGIEPSGTTYHSTYGVGEVGFAPSSLVPSRFLRGGLVGWIGSFFARQDTIHILPFRFFPSEPSQRLHKWSSIFS